MSDVESKPCPDCILLKVEINSLTKALDKARDEALRQEKTVERLKEQLAAKTAWGNGEFTRANDLAGQLSKAKDRLENGAEAARAILQAIVGFPTDDRMVCLRRLTKRVLDELGT
jgi:predicted  nucleic acid-binding Zn-ribbon protein